MPFGWMDQTNADGNPGPGTVMNIKNSLDLYCQYLGITDQNMTEAEGNVYFSSVFYESANLYVYIDPDTGYPILGVNYFSGTSIPPNGAPLVGIGTTFPEDITDGQYFLRIDYYPDRLFQKQGTCFKYIEENLMRYWTPVNRVLAGFIDNNKITNLPDGTSIPEKTAMSKVVPQRVDLYAEAKKRVAAEKKLHGDIANKRAVCPPRWIIDTTGYTRHSRMERRIELRTTLERNN